MLPWMLPNFYIFNITQRGLKHLFLQATSCYSMFWCQTISKYNTPFLDILKSLYVVKASFYANYRYFGIYFLIGTVVLTSCIFNRYRIITLSHKILQLTQTTYKTWNGVVLKHLFLPYDNPICGMFRVFAAQTCFWRRAYLAGQNDSFQTKMCFLKLISPFDMRHPILKWPLPRVSCNHSKMSKN